MKHTAKNIAMTLVLLMTASAFCGCGDAAKEATADAPVMNNAIAPDAEAPHKEAAGEDAKADAASGEPSADMFLAAGRADDTYEAAFAEGEARAEDGAAFAEKRIEEPAAAGEPAAADEPAEPVPDLPEPEPPVSADSEAFVLTAGEWNDNENWGFLANLVHNGTVTFPSYGLNPVNRIAVTVKHDGAPVQNQTVRLSADRVLWTAQTDKAGNAYLFYDSALAGSKVRIETADAEPVSVTVPSSADGQGGGSIPTLACELDTGAETQKYDKTEVMFILDTTGSMGDEISYLQKDFASIAEDVAGENVTFSVNFYRDRGDDYITRCNPFTDDIADVRKKLNAEYASGGGDAPEAVAEILYETMCSGDWHDGTNKIAFLIFDAPPHGNPEDDAAAQPEISAAIAAAAERGVRLVPVVASNADRGTELFGRAAAIMTNGNYVFLTDDSGVGDSHLEPIVGDYEVELLHDIIVRNIREIAS